MSSQCIIDFSTNLHPSLRRILRPLSLLSLVTALSSVATGENGTSHSCLALVPSGWETSHPDSTPEINRTCGRHSQTTVPSPSPSSLPTLQVASNVLIPNRVFLDRLPFLGLRVLVQWGGEYSTGAERHLRGHCQRGEYVVCLKARTDVVADIDISWLPSPQIEAR